MDALDGVIVKQLPKQLFQVRIKDGNTVTCHVERKLKTTLVRLLPGESVRIELAENNRARGRIVGRNK